MAANVPTIQTGSGLVTITPTTAKRMMLVENRDTVNAFDVNWNGSPTGWRLDPGTRKGNYVKGGVTTLTITPVAGSPSWQVELYD